MHKLCDAPVKSSLNKVLLCKKLHLLALTPPASGTLEGSCVLLFINIKVTRDEKNN